MAIQHPQETFVGAFSDHGVAVDLVDWSETIWCGKIGYAADNTGEPDVGEIMDGFQRLDRSQAAGRLEADWDVCMSVHYLSAERPNGVMFGFLVSTERQPNGFDVYRAPAARYARIRICDETARALGHEPWRGGIPPYEWIGEQLAPTFGYRYGDAALPIFEYYGFYRPERCAHDFCYLYVPVSKAEAC